MPFWAGKCRTGAVRGDAEYAAASNSRDDVRLLTPCPEPRRSHRREPKANNATPAAKAAVAQERTEGLSSRAAAPAQAAQTQRRPRACCGMLASRSASKRTSVHQHAACGTPVARCISMAHWLACPHKGHRAGLASGITAMACPGRLQSTGKSTMIAGDCF